MRFGAIVFVFFLLMTQNGFADDSKLFTTDHAAHFGISFVATELGYGLSRKIGAGKTESWFISALTVNLAGLVKEVAIDKTASKTDLYSNMAGSLGAGAFIWSFDF